MQVGAPNSPARWLSENIDSIPASHRYALVEMVDGSPRLVYSGAHVGCAVRMTDHTRQVVCELGKYRKSVGE